MKEQNKQRRALEKSIFDDAMRKIKNLKIPLDKLSVIFLSSSKWHPRGNRGCFIKTDYKV